MDRCSVCNNEVVEHKWCRGDGKGDIIGDCGTCQGTGRVCSKDERHNWRSGHREYEYESERREREARERREREAREQAERGRKQGEQKRRELREKERREADAARAQQRLSTRQDKSRAEGGSWDPGCPLWFTLIVLSVAALSSLPLLMVLLMEIVREDLGPAPAWALTVAVTVGSMYLAWFAVKRLWWKSRWIRLPVGIVVFSLVVGSGATIYVLSGLGRITSPALGIAGLLVLILVAGFAVKD